MIKDKNAHLSISSDFLEVAQNKNRQAIGYMNLRRVFLNKELQIAISDIFTLSRHVKVLFIDANGNIVGKFERMKL